MTPIIDAKSKRRLPAKLALAAGLVIAPMLALAALAAPASAEWNDNNHRDYHSDWNRGYYRAPPVVYGSPYRSQYYGSPYYAPPVVYGPRVGVAVPGLYLNIR